MTGAELLHEEEVEEVPQLRLTEAVIWAVDANLDLAAFDRGVAAGAQTVEEAKGFARPQLEASILGSQIDADRAAASFGSQPERSFSGGLALDQVIYSEPVFANITIQRRLQDSLEVQREALRLDVVQEAASTFLTLLRTQGLYEIQKENLRVTRKNLELARIRQRIGAAGSSEVYRWESAIATAEQDMVTLREAVNVARVALNRVLNRPQNTKFVPETVDHQSGVFLSGDPRFFEYVYSPRGYELFIDFMVQEGLAQSVELAAVDAAVAATRRSLSAARRRLYVPDFGLSAEFNRFLSKSGAGADGLDLQLPVELPGVDDTTWSVGLFGALPVFAGGSNRAAARRAREELYQLETERAATSERVEQRIRSALHVIGASYYSIELSQAAADAALKSLELVTDSYATGAVSITELLDAQNAALSASEAATNAVYDFLIDLMELQRAMSSFDFFQTTDDRDAFFRRLAAFLAARGFEHRPPPVGPSEGSPS
jgi:outer membrane protein TolC